MENPTLALCFPRNYYKNRRRTNLNLDQGLRGRADTAAMDRYGYSLSELVNRLLEVELATKQGVLGKAHWLRHRK